MPGSSSRAAILNPFPIISSIENQYKTGKIKEEIFIRRSISALYFALFNYWSAKKYDNGEQGEGLCKDRWPLSEFTSEMLQKGLDPQIYFLEAYRVAVDHYTLNPTIAYLYFFHMNQRTSINKISLKRAIECAKDLYKEIQNL